VLKRARTWIRKINRFVDGIGKHSSCLSRFATKLYQSGGLFSEDESNCGRGGVHVVGGHGGLGEPRAGIGGYGMTTVGAKRSIDKTPT
jgi:hypothetical protein